MSMARAMRARPPKQTDARCVEGGQGELSAGRLQSMMDLDLQWKKGHGCDERDWTELVRTCSGHDGESGFGRLSRL